MLKSPEDLEREADEAILRTLKSELAPLARKKGVPVEGLATQKQREIRALLDHLEEEGDFQPGQRLGLAPKTIENALNAFLGRRKVYAPAFVHPYEKLRSLAQKEIQKQTKPVHRAYEERPQVEFGLVVHGLQLKDPTNLIFELQGEASVGIPWTHALEYLGISARSKKPFKDLGADLLLDGVLIFQDPENEKKLRALLQARMRGGELNVHYSYFRYGIASGLIWLIQEFTAKIYLPANFRALPFDRFNVRADFNIGLGGDVVNVELVVREQAQALFAEDFDAGEFQTDTATATLEPIGYLHDPTYFVDNVARLEFTVWRNPKKMLLRIGLPLLTIAVVMLVGSWLGGWEKATSLVPSMLLAVVALQLTAAQGMPRDAELSVMDRCFVASYLLAAVLFMLLMAGKAWSLPPSAMGFVIGASAAVYFLTVGTFLVRAARHQRRSSPGGREV